MGVIDNLTWVCSCWKVLSIITRVLSSRLWFPSKIFSMKHPLCNIPVVHMVLYIIYVNKSMLAGFCCRHATSLFKCTTIVNVYGATFSIITVFMEFCGARLMPRLYFTTSVFDQILCVWMLHITSIYSFINYCCSDVYSRLINITRLIKVLFESSLVLVNSNYTLPYLDFLKLFSKRLIFRLKDLCEFIVIAHSFLKRHEYFELVFFHDL